MTQILVLWTDIFGYTSLQAIQMEMMLKLHWFWTFMVGLDMAGTGERWMMLLTRILMVGSLLYMLKGMGTHHLVSNGRAGTALRLMAH